MILRHSGFRLVLKPMLLEVSGVKELYDDEKRV